MVWKKPCSSDRLYKITIPFRRALVRAWHQANIALERHFEPQTENSRGVYDRRFPTMMFTARSISAILAFSVFIYSLSLATYSTRPLLLKGMNQPSTRAGSIPPDNPQIELNGILVNSSDGTTMVFQRTPNMSVGTIIFLHGCKHSATDFFPKGEGCIACIGLPEETRLVRHALGRNFSVLAVSSTDRAQKCWRTNASAPEGDDYERVATALKTAETNNAYDRNRPIFAVGVSSGGLFATSLHPRFSLAAVNSIVSASAISVRPPPHPPHVFTHMHVRDIRTAQRINHNVEFLRENDIPVKIYPVSPQPITADYLRAAFPSWDDDLIDEVRLALKEGEFIEATGHLSFDPRASQWRTAVHRLASRMNDSLVADQSPLSEELNRAWGAHEITSDHFSEVLDFFIECAMSPTKVKTLL